MKIIHKNMVWCGVCRSFRVASDRAAVCTDCETMAAGDFSAKGRPSPERRNLARERFYHPKVEGRERNV